MEGEGARAAEIRKAIDLLTEEQMEDRKCLRQGGAPSLSVNPKGEYGDILAVPRLYDCQRVRKCLIGKSERLIRCKGDIGSKDTTEERE